MYSVPPSRISFSVCRLTLLLRLASRSKHSLKTSISPVAASTVVNVAIDVVSGGCCSTSLSRQLGGGGCNNSSKVVWCQWVVGNRGLRADTAARIGGSFSAADSASSSDFTALTNGGRPPSLVLAPSKNNSSCNKIVRVWQRVGRRFFFLSRYRYRSALQKGPPRWWHSMLPVPTRESNRLESITRTWWCTTLPVPTTESNRLQSITRTGTWWCSTLPVPARHCELTSAIDHSYLVVLHAASTTQ